jgi:hypothetical protein
MYVHSVIYESGPLPRTGILIKIIHEHLHVSLYCSPPGYNTRCIRNNVPRKRVEPEDGGGMSLRTFVSVCQTTRCHNLEHNVSLGCHDESVPCLLIRNVDSRTDSSWQSRLTSETSILGGNNIVITWGWQSAPRHGYSCYHINFITKDTQKLFIAVRILSRAFQVA